MSASIRRRELSPRSSKLRMDRQPAVTRITDPSLAAGKRKEIDNVMRKARASSNDYWDKKLLEVEEKDPNRWRHTGYKKMYIEGESSSDSERDAAGAGASGGGNSNFRPYGGNIGTRYRSRSRSRSRSRIRKTPPQSPPMRRRSPDLRRVSPDARRPRSPIDDRRPRSPEVRRRPRSPPEPHLGRRRSPRSPHHDVRRRTPGSPGNRTRRRSPPATSMQNKRGAILPRSKRPPSPPPKPCRSRSNSSVSSCSDDSCSVCSPKHGRRPRSRSSSVNRSRAGPHSPPPKAHSSVARLPSSRPPIPSAATAKTRVTGGPATASSSVRMRPVSPSSVRSEKHREDKTSRVCADGGRATVRAPAPEPVGKVLRSRRHGSPLLGDPRLKTRPQEPAEPTPAPTPKKKKDKSSDKLRTKIKIEGEKRKKPNSSSESDDSSDSEGSLPTFTATTRLTLSERFGKMAQWSIDRSNMENIRITKDSAGGAIKVIEEGLESPPRRYSYSPAPAGHFPEELATTAPVGTLSWDDVRVRYEYYKSRGYLRDLDLKDYIKWEEWWYRYQEWLKQERYYEFWERQHRRRRKKVPITQRLN